MTQIIFLGVGGAMAQAPADNHTAFLLRAHTSTILLDSGPSIMRQLELAGVGVEELTHIYISHQHGDHSLGLPMVLLNRVLFWPELPLTVMAAPEVLSAAHSIVALAYPDLMQRMEAIIGFIPLVHETSPSPLPFDATVTYRLAPGQTHRAHLGYSIGLFIRQEPGGECRYRTRRANRAPGNRGDIAGARFLSPDAARWTGHKSIPPPARWESWRTRPAFAPWRWYTDKTPVQAAFSYRALAAKHFGGEILAPQAGDTVTLD